MMKNNNYSFHRKVHIKTCRLSKREDILVMLAFCFLRKAKVYSKIQEEFEFVYLTKSVTQDNVKGHNLDEESESLNEYC